MAAQLRQYYEEQLILKLTETFKYKNRMQVPRLEKNRVEHGAGRSDPECQNY